MRARRLRRRLVCSRCVLSIRLIPYESFNDKQALKSQHATKVFRLSCKSETAWEALRPTLPAEKHMFTQERLSACDCTSPSNGDAHVFSQTLTHKLGAKCN